MHAAYSKIYSKTEHGFMSFNIKIGKSVWRTKQDISGIDGHQERE